MSQLVVVGVTTKADVVIFTRRHAKYTRSIEISSITKDNLPPRVTQMWWFCVKQGNGFWASSEVEALKANIELGWPELIKWSVQAKLTNSICSPPENIAISGQCKKYWRLVLDSDDKLVVESIQIDSGCLRPLSSWFDAIYFGMMTIFSLLDSWFLIQVIASPAIEIATSRACSSNMISATYDFHNILW